MDDDLDQWQLCYRDLHSGNHAAIALAGRRCQQPVEAVRSVLQQIPNMNVILKRKAAEADGSINVKVGEGGTSTSDKKARMDSEGVY